MKCASTPYISCEVCQEQGHKCKAFDKMKELQKAIKYALDIKDRQHGDDYAYDDCWNKLREAIEE